MNESGAVNDHDGGPIQQPRAVLAVTRKCPAMRKEPEWILLAE